MTINVYIYIYIYYTMNTINKILSSIGIGKYIKQHHKHEIKDFCEKLKDAKFSSSFK